MRHPQVSESDASFHDVTSARSGRAEDGLSGDCERAVARVVELRQQTLYEPFVKSPLSLEAVSLDKG
jgi:hypothetical protein